MDVRDPRTSERKAFARDLPGPDAAGVRPGTSVPRRPVLSKNFAVVVRHGGGPSSRASKCRTCCRGSCRLRSHSCRAARRRSSFSRTSSAQHAGALRHGGEELASVPVIRDADLEFDQEEADDLLETVDRSLKLSAMAHRAARSKRTCRSGFSRSGRERGSPMTPSCCARPTAWGLAIT